MRRDEFDALYCEKLNTQQREAVHSVDGPVLLLAVPGSGKTTVLVNRLGYMVKCCGVDPRSILTMTYTVAATKEMKQRFAGLFGDEVASQMTFSTINALSAQIVRFYAERHGSGRSFPVVENAEAAAIVSNIYRAIFDEFPTDSTIKEIRTGITYVKNMMLTDEEIKTVDLGIDRFDKLYELYRKELSKRKLMDFDDQMIYALRALRKYPDVLEYYQERYRYICVDESQDTSKIQHEIIKLLASKYHNLFMVGDEDQSIYGFRAAYPEALLQFEQDYNGAKVLLMEKNYRSTPEIVSAANAYIARNTFRHPKSLEATRESGAQISRIRVLNREMQYAYLFAIAAECTSETAILYRNNDSALPLIDLFEREGIPYRCRQFEDAFFTHKVVADIRDIIQFAFDMKDADIFMRIYYKLGLSISKKAAVYACDMSRKSGKSILEELTNAPEMNSYARDGVRNAQLILEGMDTYSAEEALNLIWGNLRYGQFVLERKLDTGKIEILRMLARRVKSPIELLQRMEELRQLCTNYKENPECPLILSTVHSSKGLEYERVYLLDIFDGVLPSKCEYELKNQEDLRHYEEDRRIYYVAMTRAKNELFLFVSESMASEFTAEMEGYIPKEILDTDDVFAPLRGDLLRKQYVDCRKGKGRIGGQCGDRVLIVYESGETELMTLEEMLRRRDRAVRYETVNTSLKPKYSDKMSDLVTADRFVPGKRVRHNKFGVGVIVGVKVDKVEIRFENHGMKALMLETVIQNDLIAFV